MLVDVNYCKYVDIHYGKCIHDIYYRPQTKLREGNVLTPVRLFTGGLYPSMHIHGRAGGVSQHAMGQAGGSGAMGQAGRGCASQHAIG